MVDALVGNVMPHCGCDFREDRLTERVFQCSPSSPQSVTYHAQLHGTLNANVTELFTAIEEWVSTGVTIPVQFLPVTISSVSEVSSSNPSSTQLISTTTEETSTPEATSNYIIVAVSAAIVLAIVVVVAVVVIVTVCIYHQRSTIKTSNKG